MLLLLGLLDGLGGLLESLAGLTDIPLLEGLGSILKVLGRLWVGLLELCGQAVKLISGLLALLRCHLLKLAGQVLQRLLGLLQARALGRLLACQRLDITRHLFQGRLLGIGLGIDILLKLGLSAGKVCKCLLFIAGIIT